MTIFHQHVLEIYPDPAGNPLS